MLVKIFELVLTKETDIVSASIVARFVALSVASERIICKVRGVRDEILVTKNLFKYWKMCYSPYLDICKYS